MNAYELAQELETLLSQLGLKDNRIPKMLRQQADRIATLENQLDKCSHYEAMTHQEYMQQIMQLEKEKIRAYNNGYEDGWKSNTQLHLLSDEEIVQIRQTTKADSTNNWADSLAFARAIEERYGIK